MEREITRARGLHWNYWWRLVATGICFATFGIGGLLLTLLVFPWLRLLRGERRLRSTRWIIHRAFGRFIWLMEALGVMRLEVRGAKALRECRHVLVLANHPTLVDVVALIALMPNASCIVKQALWKNPFLGGVVRAAGYINNSAPEALLDACARDLAEGNPLLIFPEGTRSEPGRPMRFLRGASYLTLKSGKPVLPVLIDCQPSTLTKSKRWYQIPEQAFRLRIHVQEPIALDHWGERNPASALAARHLTLQLEQYFSHSLRTHGFTQA